jgi:cytochrome b subunit of formate dehydrogenase
MIIRHKLALLTPFFIFFCSISVIFCVTRWLFEYLHDFKDLNGASNG